MTKSLPAPDADSSGSEIYDVEVAVVTVSYGSERVLAPFLESLKAASPNRALLVSVADNRPEDGGDVKVLAHAAGASYLPLEKNLGYGGAVNRVVRDLPVSVHWVLVSNPDVVMGVGAIDILVERARSRDAIGAVGPAIRTADGDLYPSAREVPSLRNGIGHALFANLWIENPWTRAYRNDHNVRPVSREAGWLSGACLLVRRSAFESIGGFDEDFFMYFEDVDLGYRLGRAGFANIYEPAAQVTHTGAHATQGESAAMIRAHHNSARQFLAKKYSGAGRWPVRAALGASLRLRSALAERRANRTLKPAALADRHRLARKRRVPRPEDRR